MAPRNRNIAEPKRSEAEETGIPDGKVFLESLLTDERREPESETIPTRVKIPSDNKESKPRRPLKAESEKASRPQSRSTQAERELADLGEKLHEKVIGLAAVAAAVLPVTGNYIAMNAENGVSGLLSLAKRNPKILAGLQKFADGTDMLRIAQFLLGTAAAVQVDTGRLDPHDLPARVFGVSTVYDMMAAESEEQGHVTETVQTQPVNHATFVPTSP